MNNLLLSAAIGDIAGSAYEFNATKKIENVQLFHPQATYTDDTVCTFACAEALLRDLNLSEHLHTRCRQHPWAGYGGNFMRWVASPTPKPYNSFGNGSAMRCSAAGWLAESTAECVSLATITAMPTHNHPEGIKGAVATALTIFYLKTGQDLDYIRENVLQKYYPDWAFLSYDDIQPRYTFDETCQKTVPAAIICLLYSYDYADCLRHCIALGGDADTLCAIAGPMAYALHHEIPASMIDAARDMLPQWMLKVNDEFDQACRHCVIIPERRLPLPAFFTQKVKGQMRTLVDMLAELNAQNHFTSPDEAYNTLIKILENTRLGGDEVAFNCSLRAMWCYAKDCFCNGHFDINLLRERLSPIGYQGVYGAYRDYVVDKTIKMVAYLNEFRRYTNPNALCNDFAKATGGVNHCGPNPENYYFAFSPEVKETFRRYLQRLWDELAPNGQLDSNQLRELLYRRHEHGVRKYGLAAVLQRNFRDEDISCGVTVKTAWRGGAAPTYMRSKKVWGRDPRYPNRHYVKACVAKPYGADEIADIYEYQMASRILKDDKRYVETGNCFVPLEDPTLPVFFCYGGMMLFDTQEEKNKFIQSQLDDWRKENNRDNNSENK